jgi:hypothetical protein
LDATYKEFSRAFFLGYRTVMSPDSLLHVLYRLMDRGAGETEESAGAVFSALETWVQVAWGDFRRQAGRLQLLARFVKEAKARYTGCKALANLEGAILASMANDAEARIAAPAAVEIAATISLVVIEAAHLAEQLTLYNWKVRKRERGEPYAETLLSVCQVLNRACFSASPSCSTR